MDVSGFDTSNVTDMGMMFYGCNNLAVIRTPKIMGTQTIELPETFYDSQLNGCTELTGENCNMLLVKNLEDAGEKVSDESYLAYVVDNNGEPVAGAEVTYDEQTGVTDEDGKVMFDLSVIGLPGIKVSKEDFITWIKTQNEDEDEGESEKTKYETIVLQPKSEGTLKLKTANYKSTSLSQCNLLTRTKTLNLKNTGNGIGDLTTGNFTITCTALDTTNVQEYQLWQNKKMIATSTDGKFSLNVEQGFVKGGNCFVRVLSKDGAQTDTAINLTFVSNTVKENTGLSLLDNKLTIQVEDDVPYLGGSEIEVDIPKMPVDIKTTTESIYIGFNADLTDSEVDSEKVKKAIDDVKKAGTDAAGKKAKDKLKSLAKDKKTFGLPGGEFEVDFIGYAEADWGSNTAKGEICLVISAKSPKFGFDTMVTFIPVTVWIQGSAEAKLGTEISYNWETGALDGELNFDLQIGLEAFGGIGTEDIAGLGVYGDAKVELGAQLLGVTPGVEKVDLTGELGVMGYVFKLEAKKVFAYNTWHLYTRNAVQTYESSHEDSVNLYDAKAYEVMSLDYLTEESPWQGVTLPLYNSSENGVSAHTNFVSLQEGTYRNAQPVMVGDENALYAAFLSADAENGDIYVACTKMMNGEWSVPVRADETAVLDNAPQLLVDDSGTVWMSYAATAEDADCSTLLDYAQNQTIVVGTIDSDTLAFTKVKEYESVGYAHMHQLALVDGVVTLAWVDSTVTDDNSVLVSDENTVKLATYEAGTWTEAEDFCEVAHPLLEIAIGDKGVACRVDEDNDMTTTVDRTMVCYDWQGGETASVAGVMGNVSYGVLPGDEEGTFLWNGEDTLCSTERFVAVPGITSEYVVNGNDIYYSAAVSGGAELAVLRMNSDGSFGEPILLTDSGRYLENLSVVTVNENDVVFGMNTAVEITEDSITPDKNLVWAMVQPTNDIRVDTVACDTTIVTPGESVSVMLTVTNAGDRSVSEISVSVNGAVVVTEAVELAAGQSTDIEISIACPDKLTEYTVTVTDNSVDLAGDYTQDNNAVVVKLGYANLSLQTNLQQIGDNSRVLVEVTNTGVEAASGTVTLYDEEGQLLGMSTFTDLEGGNLLLIELPLYFPTGEANLNVMVTTEQEELYTHDNSDTVYVPGEEQEVEPETYSVTYELDGGVNHSDNPTNYTIPGEAVSLKAAVKTGYIFDGWYSDNCYINQVTEIGGKDSGAITLYAKWVAEEYAITYNLNGGKNNTGNPKTYNIATTTITLKNPTRTGYTFGGWYSDKALTKKVTSIVKGSTGNMTLYAKWTANKYTIKFNANGGTGTVKSVKATYDKSVKLTKNKFKREGYTFKNWNTKKNGRGKSYKNNASVKNLSATKNGSVTLYAQWTAKTYKITYYLNGGKNHAGNPKNYKVTTKTFKLKKPTKAGCTFGGWYSDKKLTKKVTQIKKGSTGNVKLYAKWTKKQKN